MNPQTYIPEAFTSAKQKYSYADYLKWETEKRIELIEGVPFELFPAPSTVHQEISGKINFVLYSHFINKPCKVFVAPFDVRFPKSAAKDEEVFTVVQPDLCVICDLKKLDKRGCLGAPDLVVEILSPGNSAREKREKYELYESEGVKEYWMVDYQEKTVFIYTLNDSGKFIGKQPLTESETLISILFPEIEINLKQLFSFQIEEEKS